MNILLLITLWFASSRSNYLGNIVFDQTSRYELNMRFQGEIQSRSTRCANSRRGSPCVWHQNHGIVRGNFQNGACFRHRAVEVNELRISVFSYCNVWVSGICIITVGFCWWCFWNLTLVVFVMRSEEIERSMKEEWRIFILYDRIAL